MNTRFPSDWRLRVAGFFGLCALLLTLLPGRAAAQSWRWAKSAGGVGQDHAYTLVTDSLGNHYMGGTFEGTATFGAITLTSAGLADGYIAKLDSAGSWLWVKQLSSAEEDGVYRLRLDERRGTLFVLGFAADNATLGTVALPVDTIYSFVTHLDMQTGTPQWINRAEGVSDVAVAPDGSLVITGGYAWGLTLGTLHGTSIPQDSSGVSDDIEMYVAGLSATGNWQWLETAGCYGNQLGTDVFVYPTGDILILGYNSNSISSLDSSCIGPFLFPAAPNTFPDAVFIAKMTSTHTWSWIKGLNTDNEQVWLAGVALGRNSQLYLAAHAFGHMMFGRDTVTRVIPGTVGVCILSITPQGQLRWSAQQPDVEGVLLHAFEIDRADRILVMGGLNEVDSVLQLGNCPPVTMPRRSRDFMAALDSIGQWVWVDSTSYKWRFDGEVLSRDRSGRLTMAGDFEGPSLTLGAFTLPNPAPTTSQIVIAQRGLPGFIDAFSPVSGPAGTVILLSGTGFLGTTGVTIGGIAAVFAVLSNGQIQVTVPPGLPTSGPGVVIQITGPNGTTVSGGLFGRRTSGVAMAAGVFTFSLYPNPAHGTARLVGLTSGAPLAQLLDGVGRTVRTQSISGAELDLRGLPAGVYTVRVGAAVRRLVVE